MEVGFQTPEYPSIPHISFASVAAMPAATSEQLYAISLGGIFDVQGVTYRIHWDRDYGGAFLQRVTCSKERGEQDKWVARQMSTLPLRRAATLRVAIFDSDNEQVVRHAYAGGLVQIGEDGDMRRFRVVRDGHGKAHWAAVGESRWPRLHALWNFLRRLTPSGFSTYARERRALQWLSKLQPAVRRVPTPAPRIEQGDDASRDPARLARNPRELMRALWNRDHDPRLDKDRDGRGAAHHVATLGNVLPCIVGSAMDALFSKPGCPLGMRDNANNTPVHLAVRHGDRRTAERFIIEAARGGFDFSLTDGEGRTVADYLKARADQHALVVLEQVVIANPSARYRACAAPDAPGPNATTESAVSAAESSRGDAGRPAGMVVEELAAGLIPSA